MPPGVLVSVRRATTPKGHRGGRALAGQWSARCSAGVRSEGPSPGGSLALKEWAVACAALRDGTQTVLLRKGGLKDPVFRPRDNSFFLFPTAFHNAGDLLRPDAARKYFDLLDYELGDEVEIEVWAELTGCWTTTDPSVLQLTSDYHVWGEGLLQTRLKWKPSQPITVMELRCHKRRAAKRLPMRDEYKGCFSWVDLDLEPNEGVVGAWEPAMSRSLFEEKQAQLREKLLLLECWECSSAVQDEV